MNKQYPKTAAFCFLIALIMKILVIINGYSLYNKYVYAPKPSVGFSLILLWIALFVIGIGSWMEKKTVIIIVSGILLIKCFISMIAANKVGLDDVFDVLTWLSLVIILILMIIEIEIPVAVLFFIPALFSLCNVLDYWFESGSRIIEYIPLFKAQVVFTVIGMLAEAAGLVFIGLWLSVCRTVKKAYHGPEAVLAYENNSNARSGGAIYEDIEKLKIYKELLDSKIISEEEFKDLKAKVLSNKR